MTFPGNDDGKLLKKINESKEDSMSDVQFGVAVEIEEDVFEKIMHWVNKSDHEVSGLGSIEIDKERNVFKVVDAILLDQENTGSTTDLSEAAVGKAMYEHHKNETPGQLKWWWHSHANMSVFWSGTDRSTMKKLAMGGWFVATVFNQSKEMKSAFIQSAPIRLMAEEIPCSIINQIAPVDPWAAQRELWDASYDEHVDEKSYEPSRFTDYSNIIRRYHGGSRFSTTEYVNNHGVTEAVEPELFPEEVEEPAEEELATLDDLFEMHKEGAITDEQLYDFVHALQDPQEAEEYLMDDEVDTTEDCETWEEIDENVYKTLDGRIVDGDGCPLLTDEEAIAMDMANGLDDESPLI